MAREASCVWQDEKTSERPLQPSVHVMNLMGPESSADKSKRMMNVYNVNNPSQQGLGQKRFGLGNAQSGLGNGQSNLSSLSQSVQ